METKFKMYYTMDEIWWNRGDERKPTRDVIDKINWTNIDTYTVSWVNETHISLIVPKNLNKTTFIRVDEIDVSNDEVIQKKYYYPIETENITTKNSEMIFELDLWCSIIVPYCKDIRFNNSVIGDTYSRTLYQKISMFDAIPSLTTPTNFKEFPNQFNKVPSSPILDNMIYYMNTETPSVAEYNNKKIFNSPVIIGNKMWQYDISDYYDVYTCLIKKNYKDVLNDMIGTVILPRTVTHTEAWTNIRFAEIDKNVLIKNSPALLNFVISNIGEYKNKVVDHIFYDGSNYRNNLGEIKLGEYKGTWKLPYLMFFKDKYKVFIHSTNPSQGHSGGFLGFFIPDDGMELINLGEYYDKNYLITSYMSGTNLFLDDNSWVFFNTNQKLRLFFNEEPYIVGQKVMFPLQTQVPISMDEYKKYVSINQKYLETGYDNQRRNIIFGGIGNLVNSLTGGLFPSTNFSERTSSIAGSREVLTPGGFSSTQNFFNDQGKIAEKIFTSAPHNKISLANNKTISTLTKSGSLFNPVAFGVNAGLTMLKTGLQLYNLKKQREAMYDQLNKSLNFSKFGSTQWYGNMNTIPVKTREPYYTLIPMYKYEGYGAKLASTQGLFNTSFVGVKISLNSIFKGSSEIFYIKPFEQERDAFEKVLYNIFNKNLADVAIDMLFQGIRIMKRQIQDSILYTSTEDVAFTKEPD